MQLLLFGVVTQGIGVKEMKNRIAFLSIFALGFLTIGMSWADDRLTVAVIGFEDKVPEKKYGEMLASLVHANLSGSEALVLVDREDVAMALGEVGLSLGGFTSSNSAVQAGQLLGAKVMVTGSVYKVDSKLTVIVRIIGTETTRLIGLDVKGDESDISGLAEEVASSISSVVEKRGSELAASNEEERDIHLAIQKKFGKERDEAVSIDVVEQHMGSRSAGNQTAENEMVMAFTAAGYKVYESEDQAGHMPDYRITGRGLAEFSGRRGELISVKARIEVKVVDVASGKIVVVDRESSSAIDTTERLAGGKALQEAALILSERLLQALESEGL